MQTTDNATTRYEGSPTGQAFGQAPGAQALAPQSTLRRLQGDPPQRRGGVVRAVEDRHRRDEGIPRRAMAVRARPRRACANWSSS